MRPFKLVLPRISILIICLAILKVGHAQDFANLSKFILEKETSFNLPPGSDGKPIIKPADYARLKNIQVAGINKDGWVVGSYDTDNGVTKIFVISTVPQTYILKDFFIVDQGVGMKAADISDEGHVVYNITKTNGSLGARYKPFVAGEYGQTIDLVPRGDPQGNQEQTKVFAINNNRVAMWGFVSLLRLPSPNLFGAQDKTFRGYQMTVGDQTLPGNAVQEVSFKNAFIHNWASYIYDVNSRGEVCGSSAGQTTNEKDRWTMKPMVRFKSESSGKLEVLSILDNVEGEAKGLNNFGMVCGQYYEKGKVYAFLWNQACLDKDRNKGWTTIPGANVPINPDGADTYANRINNNGIVVGHTGLGTSQKAYAYFASMTPAVSPEGTTPQGKIVYINQYKATYPEAKEIDEFTHAYDVNDKDYVIGRATVKIQGGEVKVAYRIKVDKCAKDNYVSYFKKANPTDITEENKNVVAKFQNNINKFKESDSETGKLDLFLVQKGFKKDKQGVTGEWGWYLNETPEDGFGPTPNQEATLIIGKDKDVEKNRVKNGYMADSKYRIESDVMDDFKSDDINSAMITFSAWVKLVGKKSKVVIYGQASKAYLSFSTTPVTIIKSDWVPLQVLTNSLNPEGPYAKDGWTNISIQLPPYFLGKQVKFAFEFESDCEKQYYPNNEQVTGVIFKDFQKIIKKSDVFEKDLLKKIFVDEPKYSPLTRQEPTGGVEMPMDGGALAVAGLKISQLGLIRIFQGANNAVPFIRGASAATAAANAAAAGTVASTGATAAGGAAVGTAAAVVGGALIVGALGYGVHYYLEETYNYNDFQAVNSKAIFYKPKPFGQSDPQTKLMALSKLHVLRSTYYSWISQASADEIYEVQKLFYAAVINNKADATDEDQQVFFELGPSETSSKDISIVINLDRDLLNNISILREQLNKFFFELTVFNKYTKVSVYLYNPSKDVYYKVTPEGTDAENLISNSYYVALQALNIAYNFVRDNPQKVEDLERLVGKDLGLQTEGKNCNVTVLIPGGKIINVAIPEDELMRVGIIPKVKISTRQACGKAELNLAVRSLIKKKGDPDRENSNELCCIVLAPFGSVDENTLDKDKYESNKSTTPQRRVFAGNSMFSGKQTAQSLITDGLIKGAYLDKGKQLDLTYNPLYKFDNGEYWKDVKGDELIKLGLNGAKSNPIIANGVTTMVANKITDLRINNIVYKESSELANPESGTIVIPTEGEVNMKFCFVELATGKHLEEITKANFNSIYFAKVTIDEKGGYQEQYAVKPNMTSAVGSTPLNGVEKGPTTLFIPGMAEDNFIFEKTGTTAGPGSPAFTPRYGFEEYKYYMGGGVLGLTTKKNRFFDSRWDGKQILIYQRIPYTEPTPRAELLTKKYNDHIIKMAKPGDPTIGIEYYSEADKGIFDNDKAKKKLEKTYGVGKVEKRYYEASPTTSMKFVDKNNLEALFKTIKNGKTELDIYVERDAITTILPAIVDLLASIPEDLTLVIGFLNPVWPDAQTGAFKEILLRLQQKPNITVYFDFTDKNIRKTLLDLNADEVAYKELVQMPDIPTSANKAMPLIFHSKIMTDNYKELPLIEAALGCGGDVNIAYDINKDGGIDPLDPAKKTIDPDPAKILNGIGGSVYKTGFVVQESECARCPRNLATQTAAPNKDMGIPGILPRFYMDFEKAGITEKKESKIFTYIYSQSENAGTMKDLLEKSILEPEKVLLNYFGIIDKPTDEEKSKQLRDIKKQTPAPAK